MFVGVRPCIILFRHFFVLVKFGKSKDEIGVYYFQMRSGSPTPYIHALAGEKWEDWCREWVIASTEASDRLILPTDGPPPTARTGEPSRLCRRHSAPY